MKLIFFVLLFQALGFPKTKPVRGYVIEENSSPLEKVKVVSLPSKISADTNKEGLFVIEIPVRDRKLIVSKAGYHTDTLNVIFFKNNSVITLREFIIENPLENINQYISFVVSRRDNNIFHYPIEDLFLSGYGNLESILSKNTFITTKTGLDGQKKISYRESTGSDMDLLYDGIKLDGMKNSLRNLSIVSGLAISDLVLTKGGHYRLTASQGAINFIPSINYNNKFSLNIEQSNNNPNAAIDGYGSLGFKYGLINGSIAGKEFAVAYSDTNAPEVFTNIERNSYNIAYTNAKNLDVRFMSFDNIKNYSNQRTNSSISDTVKNKIVKLSQWSPLTGLITLFGLSQNNKDTSYLIDDFIAKDYKSWGGGMSIEKDFENSVYTFSTISNVADISYIFNLDSIFIERQNSIFSGSVKYFFPSNERNINLKNLSFVYTKERTTDIPKPISSLYIKDNYWDNTSIQIRSSVKSKKFPRITLGYINVGNVLRTPSIDEVANNRVRILNPKKGLAPEKKSIYEMGFSFNDKTKTKPQKFKIDFSCFGHIYTNRINRILISGTSLYYPVNVGNISIYGFNNKLVYFPKWSWAHFETTVSGYSTPDFSFFPSHSAILVNHHTFFSTKYFDILIKLRSEGGKYISFINGSSIIQTIELDPANYVDVMIYKNVNYKIFNLAVSLSAENLQSKKLVIDNMNLFNNRYSVNVHLSIL